MLSGEQIDANRRHHIQDSQSALDYDSQARRTNWFGPEVVFGLAYEYVKAGDSLLARNNNPNKTGR